MKKLIVVAMMLLVASFAFGQTPASSASQTANINITVNTGIQLAVANSVNFGTVIAGVTAIVAPKTAGNNAATFTLTSSPGVAVTVTYPASVALGSLTFTPDLVGTDLAANRASASSVASGASVTPAGSNYYFYLGGNIPTTSGTSAGTYNGTFTLSVAY